jgi:transcriptional regulator with XRE-family HTH domain
MPSAPKRPGPQRGLGEAVRVLRERAKLTGAFLAQRSEISPSWLSRIEDGQVDPTWGTMRRIARGLDVPLERLSEVAEDFERRSSERT